MPSGTPAVQARRSRYGRRPAEPLEPPGRPSMRVTMRARVLTVLLAVALILLAPGLARGDGPDRPAARTAYTVEAGDTLWGIARRLAPDRDPREVVDQMVRDNRIHGSLQVGQRLLVPVSTG